MPSSISLSPPTTTLQQPPPTPPTPKQIEAHTQAHPPTLRERNRANQAASRQRTKSRIATLEARLAAYERAGVSASTEVQQAARAVVAENAALRRLLSSLGIDGQAVHNFLQDGVVPLVPGSSFPSSGPDTRPHGANAAVPHPGVEQSSQPPSSEVDGHDTAQPPTTEIVHVPAPGPNQRTNRHETQQPDQQQHPTPPIHTETPHASESATVNLTDTADETACQDAALIIASLRGRGDTADQVWAELGCGPDRRRRCRMKNARIFDLAEGAEGSGAATAGRGCRDGV